MFGFVPRWFRLIFLCCVLCVIFLTIFVARSRLNILMHNKLSSSIHLTLNEEIQLERKKLVEEKCRDIKYEPRNVFGPVSFKIEDRHQVIYCDVPKVASTNMKRLMLILSGEVKTDHLFSIPRITVHENSQMRKLEAYDNKDFFQFGVANYTKVIFVRHPYERLFSAYQDKLAGNNMFYQLEVGREIIRKYRKQPTQLSLRNGHDVTFGEFVSYVIDQWKEGKRQLDVHWRPLIDLCLPCSIEYDFVGKFETLNQDVEFFLKRLNESDLSQLFILSKPSAKTAMSSWKHSMRKISHTQLNDLNYIFGEDFRIFGYPHYTGTQ